MTKRNKMRNDLPSADYIEISRRTPSCDFRDMPRVDSRRLCKPILYPNLKDYFAREVEKYKGEI